mgnify:CR=1 FL=1
MWPGSGTRWPGVRSRRSEGVALLRGAVAAGEIDGDIDVDIAADLLYGALFFRLLLGHAPVDAKLADAALERVIGGPRR